MKRKFVIAFLLVSTMFMSACGNKAHGEDGLIKLAKKYYSDNESVAICGSVSHDDNTLVWFDCDATLPCPLSFIKHNNTYEYVNNATAVERGPDIWISLWDHSIVFYVDNPDCTQINIDDSFGHYEIPVTNTPFVTDHSYKDSSFTDYVFLDKDGNELLLN